ncbi:hypothetical protein QBC39DRAFT_184572 [Podospora conica]|nr:hypothetical protein QBC39DRAFT_184572 [Schizothecium conicum]
MSCYIAHIQADRVVQSPVDVRFICVGCVSRACCCAQRAGSHQEERGGRDSIPARRRARKSWRGSCSSGLTERGSKIDDGRAHSASNALRAARRRQGFKWWDDIGCLPRGTPTHTHHTHIVLLGLGLTQDFRIGGPVTLTGKQAADVVHPDSPPLPEATPTSPGLHQPPDPEPSGSPERRSASPPLFRWTTNTPPPPRAPPPRPLDRFSSLAGRQLLWCRSIAPRSIRRRRLSHTEHGGTRRSAPNLCMAALPHTACRGSAGHSTLTYSVPRYDVSSRAGEPLASVAGWHGVGWGKDMCVCV